MLNLTIKKNTPKNNKIQKTNKHILLRTGKKENCFLILDTTPLKRGNECSDKTYFIGQINLAQTDSVM